MQSDKMQPYFVFLLVLVICSFAGAAQTTYYVDNLMDSDQNSGTSVNSSWKTIQRANLVTLRPGDSLLFRRGGKWQGNFWPKGSGTDGKPIVVAAYGNGALPELDAKGFVDKGEKASCTIRLYKQEYWEFKNLKIKNFKPSEKPVSVEGQCINSKGGGFSNHRI